MTSDPKAFERAKRYASLIIHLSDRWVDDLTRGTCSQARSLKYERLLARMQEIVMRGLR